MLHFFDTIPLPTIVVNKENEIVFINEIGSQFLDISSDYFTLKPITLLLPELQFSTLINKKVFTTSYTHSTGYKQSLTIQFDSCVVLDVEYKFFYINDLSKFENSPNSVQNFLTEIQKQNKMLLNHNNELKQFTYVASHDLQEPLLSLISYSKLLEEEYEDKLDEEGKLFVQFINKSAVRMRSLISGLMQYAQINKIEDFVKTDLQFSLQEVQDDLFNKINKYKAIITVEKLPSLYCNPTYIRLLFQNLISNAIKFSKKDIQPKIHISYTERENDWLFQVKDNGIGIDSKNLEQIFMIFKRLHNEQDYAGYGIGLAHSKKIIEIHNGEIWVESELGQGSTFNFTISKNIK